jgi:DNA adenine methylase
VKEKTKPFLKWAGSKFKIIENILLELPKGNQLIEPFAGSGAVFLNAQYDNYLVADSNPDLINLYKHIKTHGQDFCEYAKELFTPETNNQEVFYEFRNEFNTTKNIERKSALFIYLNRHCFNGLFRCNSKGHFNVPFGKYSNPAFPYLDIMSFHKKSQNVEFQISDFLHTMDQATEGSVVYCDPPYAPLTETSNFSDYTLGGFNLHDQLLLAKKAQELWAKGIPVIISNHDTPFTREIYQGSKIVAFDVQRFISSKAANRKKAAELIACYG